MPTIRRSRPWTTKPPVAKLGNSPYAQGVAFFVPMWDRVGLAADIASGIAANAQTATWGESQYGATTSYGSQYISFASAPIANALNLNQKPFTVAFAGNPAASTPQIVLDTRGSAAASGWVVNFDSSGGNEFDFTDAVNGTASSNNGVVDGNWHVFSLTVTSPNTTFNAAFYRDGLSIGSAAGGGAVTSTVGNSPIAAGWRGTLSGTKPYAGSMGWLGAWSWAFSAADHALLFSGPNAIWQIFQPARGMWQIPSFGVGPSNASIAITADGDSLAASAVFTVPASISITESHNAFAGSGAIQTLATAAIAAGSDTAAIVAAFTSPGSIGITAGSDSFAGAGLLTSSGSESITETAGTLAALGIFTSSASLSVSERLDVLAALARFGTSGAITLSELRDTFAGMNVPAVREPTFNPFAAKLVAITHSDPTRAEIDPYRATLLSIGITDPTRAETDPYAATILA
jgi:hypothetical protein